MKAQKKLALFFGLFSGFALAKKTVPESAYRVDSIQAVVYFENYTDVLTLSDTYRPALDGTMRTLEELALEKMMYRDALVHRMGPDDEQVDKHLKSIQRQHGLSLNDLKNMFTQAGYTYEQGREQFATMAAVNSIIDFKIRSQLVIPEREVVAYYEQNPQVQDAAYFLETAFIADNLGDQELLKKVEDFTYTKKTDLEVDWSAPFWVEATELAQEKNFIHEMFVGDISFEQSNGGYNLFRLVDKRKEHARSLEERYREITDLLRKPKYELLFDNYKKELFDSASIVYFS